MIRNNAIAIPANEQRIVNRGLVFNSLSNSIPPNTPKAIMAPISNAKLE